MNLIDLPNDILELIIKETKIKKFHYEQYFEKYIVEYYRIIKVNRWFYSNFDIFKADKKLVIYDNTESCVIT